MTQNEGQFVNDSFESTGTKIIQYTIIYVLASFAWMLVSDQLAHLTILNPLTNPWASTLEGLFFVSVTGMVLYLLMHRLAASVHDFEKSYKIVFDHASDSIFLADASGNILDANEKAEELLGSWRSEILQMKMPEFLYPWLSDGAQTNVDEMKTGKPILAERSFIRKDGKKLVLESSLRRLPDGRVLAIVRDVTEKRRAEEELRREEQKRRQLERQLMQTQKIESLGSLASGIAHDFNNILNIIGANAALLPQRATDPTKLSKSVSDISAASDRGAFLVKQLLTFARESGTVLESVDLNQIVHEIVTMVKETFPKNIVVLENLQPNLPRIVGDRIGLHLAILNLCVNARDAMPQGGELVLTTLICEPDKTQVLLQHRTEKRLVEVSVADTGIGMSAKTREALLDPFSAGEPEIADTSFGLSLVHSIVQTHQGLFDIKSEPERGNTFSVYLPTVEKDKKSSTKSTEELPLLLDGTETILIIEDEEMLAEIVRFALESRGYKVFCAHDGEEGLKVFSENHVEIAAVITDQGLPKMEGTEIIRRVKKINPGTKVVLASGFIDAKARAEMLEAGADAFMQKPYSPANVLKIVRKVINEKS